MWLHVKVLIISFFWIDVTPNLDEIPIVGCMIVLVWINVVPNFEVLIAVGNVFLAIECQHALYRLGKTSFRDFRPLQRFVLVFNFTECVSSTFGKCIAVRIVPYRLVHVPIIVFGCTFNCAVRLKD